MTTATNPPPAIDPGPQFIGVPSIARALGVHEISVRRWIMDGKIPVVRFPNRRIAVHIDEWRRWTDELGQVAGHRRSDFVRTDPHII